MAKIHKWSRLQFLMLECESWFETVHTRGTNENTICLCRNGIYKLMVESSSTTIRIRELSFSIHGRLARWCNGAVGRTDCKRKDSAVTNDFTTTLLGDVRKRVYTRHQQSRRTEDSMCRQQPRPSDIYGAALGLYNSRIIKLINKKGQLKSSVIIDELPNIYFKGLDNLIATARSNKVAVCLGFQDFSQLVRDYGDKEAKAVINTVGNIFSGQVVGETSKTLSERFGKVLQKRQSISINRQDVSTSINTQMDSLIPSSKISRLTETPHHQRFLGCGWQRLYGADHTGQLQPNQGRCQADSQG